MVQNRNTRQKTILETELKKFKTFFSAEDLLEKVSKIDNKIGIATVYRFLKKVRYDGDVFSYTCGGKSVYSNNSKNHCHFECEETGKVVHFEIDNLDFLKDKIPGKITSFQLEIKGICNDICTTEGHNCCQNKKK